MAETLSSGQRLKRKHDIDRLFSLGKKSYAGPLRCYLLVENRQDGSETESSRAFFSVPKKMFRRANRRNELKRRMREAYRHSYGDITERLEKAGKTLCVGFVYSSRETSDYKTIEDAVRKTLGRVSGNL